MLRLEDIDVSFKIAPPESLSIIGSNSIDTAGDLYVVDFNTIIKPHNIRNKRLADMAISSLFLLFSPVLILFIRPINGFYKNCFYVLLGIKSWVGFFYGEEVNTLQLPKIRKGVISWALVNLGENPTAEKAVKINLLYAKDYHVGNDFSIIIKGWRLLGRT